MRAIVEARERRRAVHVGVGLLRARRHAAGQRARAREPGQVRRARLHRRAARRDAGGARAGDRRRPEVAGRRARRAGLDLRPRRPWRRRAAAAPSAGHRHRVRQAELLAAEKETLGLYVIEPPAGRRARPAAAQGRPADPRAAGPARGRARLGRRPGRVAAPRHHEGATRWRSSGWRTARRSRWSSSPRPTAPAASISSRTA